MSQQKVVHANAKSVAHKPLPPIPEGVPSDAVTLILFYQYVEPMWSKKMHKKAIAKVIALGQQHSVTGRGRCAAEGLNCTLTGSAKGARAFCMKLREWNGIFDETDFKFTDGLEPNQKFKALTIRKVDELVAYGLEGNKAPSIKDHSGVHLEATEYHKMMTKPDNNTVIIDVRNAYESAIGHFQPPTDGAELIDPEMRNSRDFPRWLNLPETQQKLQGKKVMMYCTGGIRCERASALLNQMQEVTPGFKTDGVYELRGGIERYLKTFPEGGLWKGANYTFDRRMAQVPAQKSAAALAADARDLAAVDGDRHGALTSSTSARGCRAVGAICAACGGGCAEYRGKYKCGGADCGVPVIVCGACQRSSSSSSFTQLRCGLCRKGLRARDEAAKPDLLLHKRLLGKTAAGAAEQQVAEPKRQTGSKVKKDKKQKRKDKEHSAGQQDSKKPRKSQAQEYRRSMSADAVNRTATTERLCSSSGTGDCRRIFVGRLPLLVTASRLKTALGLSEQAAMPVQWLTDHSSGSFYGSAFVAMPSQAGAQELVSRARTGAGVVIDGQRKKLKVNFAPAKEGESWPPVGHQNTERPPVGGF